MESQLRNVHRIESADGIRDGEYFGRWCGNQVRFTTNFGDYQGDTGNIYVKGDEPCVVTYLAGVQSVRVVPRADH